MKNVVKYFLGIALIGSALLSCSKGQESELSIDVSSSKEAYVFPRATQSCTNRVALLLNSEAQPTKDISKFWFALPLPTLSWSNTTDTFYMDHIKVEVKGANISGSCTFAEEDVLAIYYDFSATATPSAGVWNGAIGPGLSRAAGCNLICGGISVPNEDLASTASGLLTVVGYQRDSQGNEKPVRTTKTFSVRNL